MNHYFTNNPDLPTNRKNIDFRFLSNLETFISDNGVFSKDTLDYGSRSMLESLVEQNISGDVLDLGCGIGVIGILLKKYIKDINLTSADINERAVELTKANSELYHQNNNVIVSDGFANISQNFDVIVSNPPIRTGKQNIYRLFKEAYDHLKNGGSLYLVIRAKQGAESSVAFLKTFFQQVEVIKKDKGYWIILCHKD